MHARDLAPQLGLVHGAAQPEVVHHNERAARARQLAHVVHLGDAHRARVYARKYVPRGGGGPRDVRWAQLTTVVQKQGRVPAP